MPSNLLTLNDLEITFPAGTGETRAVRSATFSLAAGEMLALVGESGSGKTVTGLAAMGLLPRPGFISSGGLCFEGRDMRKFSRRDWRALRGREIGMVFQEPMTSLDPVYTVGYQLAEALTSHGPVARAEVTERSAALLAEVGISEPATRLEAYPHQLSGGIRQRVMIATALALGPKLLIADEPTTALDVTVGAQIMALIGGLKQNRGMAVLFITHDLGLVAGHADRVAVMYAGYVVELAPASEIFRNPLHPYTRALMRAMPSGTGKGRLTPIPGNVPRPGALPPGCPFSDRCSQSDELCREIHPELAFGESGRAVRCLKADPDD